jgi:hypothetical protein
LLWTFLSLCFPLVDTDFWWHLKTGEWIVQEGRVPQVDLYTFTEVNTPWIDLHWGFQLLITLLYRLGGENLVILTKAGVITAAVAVTWHAGGRGLPTWGKAGLWILPVVCISGRGYERPEMLSLLFLAVWLWLATNVERRPRWIWVLPVLQVVWVNCHALFVLGLAVGACYVADGVARDFARGRWGLAPPAAAPSARAIIWAGGLVVLACLVNPYFEEGALFPLVLYRKFSADQAAYATIGEFQQPVDFVRKYGWRGVRNIYVIAELGVWFLAAASFVLLAWRRRRWSVLRLLLFAGFSHLAWKAVRNTNIFSLVSGFVACENLSEAFALSGVVVPVRAELRRIWLAVGVVAALIVAVVTGFWNELGDQNKPFGFGEAPEWFIHDAARFAGREGFPHRAFVSHNGQAPVYIYHNAPERFVYMDARLEVCSLATFNSYNEILMQMARGEPHWQNRFRAGGGELPVVILDNRFSILQIAGLLETPGWRLVYSDRVAAVFLSNAQAGSLELPAVEPASSIRDRVQKIREAMRELKARFEPAQGK